MPAGLSRPIINRAAAEVDAGRPWRAKEILQGSMGCELYALEPDFLEAYGALLDSLGDRFEAGKYLFLSGKRTPEYAEAIELFRRRTRNANINAIVGSFPTAVRRHGLGHLPQVVRDELEARGVRPSELNRREPLLPETPPLETHERLLIVSVIGGFVLLVATSFVGCVTLARWAF